MSIKCYLKNNIKNLKYSSTAFVGSFFGLFVIFALLGIIGSGDKSIYIGDLYAQYIPFISSFLRIIKGEGSFWYSFSNYLGSGNVLTNMYYCLSPFNFLFLFSDYLGYENVIILVTLCKFAFSAFCFEIFIYKYVFNKKWGILLSIFYSLSAFSLCFYYNIMWLDVMYFIPLVVMLIIRFVNEDKYIALIVCYFLMFLTNFYMSYIVGIFSALVFILYLLYIYDFSVKANLKNIVRKIFYFIGIVFCAAGLTAFLLLPTWGFMSGHMAEDNLSFEKLTVTIPDIINALFIGQMQSVDNNVPMLYCGVPILLFSVLFFLNKKIEKKIKIVFSILLSVYLLAMICLPVYMFMHAFDYPNAYGYRFSVVVIFIISVMGTFSLKFYSKESFKYLIYIAIAAIIFYSFMIKYQLIDYQGGNTNTQQDLVINSIFIGLWLVLIYIIGNLTKPTFKYKVLFVLSLILCITEVVCNGYICLNKEEFYNIKDSYFNQWYYAEKELIDEIKENDRGFYRVYVNNEWCSNAAKQFGYNSLVTFSSSDNYYLRKPLSKLGIPVSNRFINLHGLLEPLASVFDVKYYVALPDFDEFVDKEINKDNYIKGSYTLNDKALSLAFMVSEDIYNYHFTDNSFDNIESLLSSMVGKDYDIFDKVNDDDVIIDCNNYNIYKDANKYYFESSSDIVTGGNVVFSVDSDEEVYIDFGQDDPKTADKVPTVYSADNGLVSDNYISQGGIYRFIDIGEGKRLIIINDEYSSDFSVDNINYAKYNQEIFDDVYNDLSSNQMELIYNEEDRLGGIVTATEEKTVLFTSIPYDDEWIVYVDGVPYPKTVLVGGAFLGVQLTPGQHTVEFEYVEKYAGLGALISSVCLLIFVFIVIKYIFMHIRRNDSSIIKEAENVENGNDEKES